MKSTRDDLLVLAFAILVACVAGAAFFGCKLPERKAYTWEGAVPDPLTRVCHWAADRDRTSHTSTGRCAAKGELFECVSDDYDRRISCAKVGRAPDAEGHP